MKKLIIFSILFFSISIFSPVVYAQESQVHSFIRFILKSLKDKPEASWDASITKFTLPNGNKVFEIKGLRTDSISQTDLHPLIVEISGDKLIELGRLDLWGPKKDTLNDGRSFYSIAINPQIIWAKYPDEWKYEKDN